MKNRLMLLGIGRGLTWMCAGTLVMTLRLGDLRFQFGAPALGTLLSVVGLLLILSHRPQRVLGRLALCCLLADLLALAAVLAAGWPGVDRWITLIPGPAAGILGGLLILRAGKLASDDGLTDSGGTLRTLGWIWLVVQGLLTTVIAAFVLAQGQGFKLKVPEVVACGTWALFAVPCVAGIATARNLLAAIRVDWAKCTNCGFSLVGLRSGVCPECGLRFEGIAPAADEPLAQAKPIAGWATLLAFAIFAAGGATYFQAPANGLERHKPYWMLRRDIEATQPASQWGLAISPTTITEQSTPGAWAAMKELADRVSRGALRPKQIEELAERVLDAQQDQSVSFDEWAKLAEPMVAAGVMTAEQRERFTKQSLQFALRAPARVKAGQPIAVRIEAVARPRGGVLSSGGGSLLATAATFSIGGREFRLGQALSSSNSSGMLAWSYESGALAGIVEVPRAPLALGTHRLEAVVQFDQFDNGPGSYPSQKLVLSTEIEVVGANASPAFGSTDDVAVKEEIRRALEVTIRNHYRGEGGILHFSVPILESWKCDVVADVIAEVNGTEAVMGPVVLRKDFPYASVEITSDVLAVLKKAPGRINVRLRPNLDAAWTAIGVTTVWAGEEIEIEAQWPEGPLRDRVRPARPTTEYP